MSYKYRVQDARLGRFLSIDPLAAKYPFYSPYAFSGNRVIDGVELEGLEYVSAHDAGVDPNRVQNDDGTYSEVRNLLIGLERARTNLDDSHGLPVRVYGTGRLDWINTSIRKRTHQ